MCIRDSIKNEPLDPDEIQVLLAAAQEYKVSLKNLNPAEGIRLMLEEPDVQNWLKYHLKRDQEITGVQMGDPGDFYYKLVAMSDRAALNPIARRHLYVSMLWYINGDQDELPKREAEALHQFRSVLNYVEQLQQADHYIERYSTRFPDQAKEAEVAGQRMENILVLNENINASVSYTHLTLPTILLV